MSPGEQPRRSAVVLAIGVIWLGLALVLGASGRLEAARPPAPQLLLIGLTLAALVAGVVIPSVRRWAMTVDLRIPVALHLTRFVGVYFLVLYGRGDLPYAFAVPAGWGDIIVAVLALALLASGPPSSRGRRGAYAAWNVLGLLDILFVVATATRLAMSDPGSMAALLRLPLSILPTFLVPLIIASHVLIAVRLARGVAEPRPRAAG